MSTPRPPASARSRRRSPAQRPSAGRANQSQLHRDPRADRRQDQQHCGHRRQRRLADQWNTGDDRQPGPDVRDLSDLRSHRARSAQPLRPEGRVQRGGHQAAPTGRHDFQEDGKLDYVSPTVAENTDTVTLRGVVPNPVVTGMKAGEPGSRILTDGEFVTVMLEGVQPITVLGIPRAAVLSDQQGDYVYIVDAEEQGANPSHPTRSIDTVDCGDHQRAQRRRACHQRRSAARPPRRGGIGRAGVAPPPGAAPAGAKTMISAIFVDRPRLAVVIAIVITIAGLFALTRLPVAQFPDIVPPQVQVSAVIRGLRGGR